MSLIAELRRRNVFRMAGLYLVGAWLVLQVSETLLPIFDTPAWVLKALVYALALGFVVAVAVAWLFELTAEGLKREGDVPVAQSIKPQTRARMNRLMVLLTVLALLYFVTDKFYFAPQREAQTLANAQQSAVNKPGPTAQREQRSIAVLPLVNMSGDPANEYFSDGFAETTLDMLARVADLKVIARTSSFAFKGKAMDVREIGQKLGAAFLLEGSVQQSGNTLRITTQLVRTSDGAHVWSQRFDRQLADVFKIQDEVATEVVRAIQGALPEEGQRQLLTVRTQNFEAYQEYLRGMALLPNRLVGDMRKALVHFKRAIELDPAYAKAYAAAATATLLLEEYGAGDANSEARLNQYVEKALQIDPNLGEAYIAKAGGISYFKNSLDAADTFKRGIALSPNYATGYQWYGEWLLNFDQPKNALAVFEQAIALDPLSAIIRVQYVEALIALDRLQDAERMNLEIMAQFPEFSRAMIQRADLLSYRGDLRGALTVVQKFIDSDPETYVGVSKRCRILIDFGAVQAAQACVASPLLQKSQDHSRKEQLAVAMAELQGQYTQAAAIVKRMKRSSPWQQALYANLSGNPDQALALYQKMVPELLKPVPTAQDVSYPFDPVVVSAALLNKGKTAQANTLLRVALKSYQGKRRTGATGVQWADTYSYALLRDWPNACATLQNAADEGFVLYYRLLANDPLLNELRQQPCFKTPYTQIESLAKAKLNEAANAGLL